MIFSSPRLFFFLLLLLSLHVLADGSMLQPPEIVESTPIEIFSQKTGRWSGTKVSSEELKVSATSGIESLGRIPGVSVRRGGSPTFSIRGSYSFSRVLGLVNGIPLGSADGLGPEMDLIPAENIDSVHLIKGPASVFYGSSAMGGAANFKIKDLQEPVVRGELESFGGRGIFAGGPLIGAGEKEPALQATAYSKSSEGNFPYSVERTGQSGEMKNNDSYLQRFTVTGRQKAGHWDIRETAVHTQNIGTTPGPRDFPESFAFKNALTVGGVDAVYDINDASDLSLRAYGSSRKKDYDSYNYGKSFADSKRLGSSVSYRRAFASRFQVEGFIDQNYEEYETSFETQRFYDRSLEPGFLAEIPVDEIWVVRPGLRYLGGFGRAISAAGLFRERKEDTTWITYAEGFRPPSLTERFGQAYNYEPNPSLKPEISKQIEMGYKTSGKFPYSMAIFSTGFEDFVGRTTLSGGKLQRSNSGSAKSSGFEGSVGYSEPAFSQTVSIATLSAYELVTGRPIPLSPATTVSAQTSLALGPVLFELSILNWGDYYDRDLTDKDVKLGSWTTVDFGARTFALADWTASVQIFNLFDKPRELTLNYPESQRRIWAALERSF